MNILYLSFINQFAIVAISLLSVYYPLPILLRSHPFSVFGSGDLPNQTKMAAHNNKEPTGHLVQLSKLSCHISMCIVQTCLAKFYYFLKAEYTNQNKFFTATILV